MSRLPLILVVASLTPMSAPARADEKEAKETLARAIKAHGGASLAAAVRSKRTDTGTHTIGGRPVAFVSAVSRELPERVRLDIDLAKGAIKTLVVLDGDRGYSNDGGATTSLAPPRVKELREEAYIDWLTTLLPLQKNDIALTSADKAKVNGEAAVGVVATRKGWPTVTLYFSEKTDLLIRAEWRGTLAGLGVDFERNYSGHKTFDGVKLHTKETAMMNGKKITEFVISDVSFPARFDAKTFAKP